MKVNIVVDYIYHAQNTNHSKLNACYVHTFYYFANGKMSLIFQAQLCLRSN